MPALDRQLVYGAGPWAVDLARRELRADGVPVPIGGRAFEIVEVLIEAAGELVTKDDIMARVWPGVFVEENTLQVHISAVRRALGPDRELLKTVAGRGYRLLGRWTAQQPAMTATDGAIPRTAGRPFTTNFPAPTSELIGRETAVQHLRDLLSAYRVVTLTGPGGIGKTALALEVARRLFPSFEGDGRLVELASLSDPGLLPSAVAGALGFRLGDETTFDAVATAIGGNALLLVLDNCEHVIDAVAKLVETLIRLCPRTSVLATSREVLRIDGECVYRVSPLDAPSQDQDDPNKILGHGAVQLFIARAAAWQADASPDAQSLPAIAAICRRLDGIPLAIEFAAARAATLGLRRVAERLNDRFGLLAGGRRTALARHQTLRATLDWSYELLPDLERHLLRHLAVFPAGFTLEAASAVRGDTDDAASDIEALVANLVAKSLVQLDGSAPGGRWRMLETIRAYAMVKLKERGEAEMAARRHAEFFRDLFAPATAASRVQPGIDDMARRVRELDNVRAALDWCFSAAGDTATGITLTAAYVSVWLHLSLVAECRERAERVLQDSALETTLSAPLQMQLYIAFGTALVQSTGAEERTGSVLSKGLEIAGSADDADAELRALWAMWCYLDHKGEHREALSLAERFSRTARRKADPADVFVGDRLIGYTLHYLGSQSEARRYLEGVVGRYVAPADQRHVIWFQHDQRVVARTVLARVLCLQGLLDQARHNAQASLADAQTADQTLTLRYVLGWGVCPVSLLIGDLEAAAASVAMLVDLATRRHLPFWQTVGRALEGALLIKRGEYADGVALLQEAIDTQVRPGWAARFPDLLGALADGLAGTEQFGEARAAVERALAGADRSGVRWYAAELLRIKGELLVQATGDQMTAETCFQTALDMARQQGALLWELRSAMSLARLRTQQGRHDDATPVLGPVHGRFTEGFDTADLRAARAMLQSLPPYQPSPT